MSDRRERRFTHVSAEARRWLRRVLVAGAALQLIAAAAVSLAWRYGAASGSLSPGGVLKGGDGPSYLGECVGLGRHVTALFSYNTQVHVRLYALSSALLSPVFGAYVFSLEAANLPLYVLCLFLTYKIGETCYGGRAGLLSAALVLLFPTLLLHSTQPFRDPLFVDLMLAFTWLLLRLLTDGMGAARAAAYAACGFALLLLLWMVRGPMLPIYFGMIALASVSLVASKLRRGGMPLPNLACLLLLLASALIIPRTFAPWAPPNVGPSAEQREALDKFAAEESAAGRSGLFLKLALTRQKFIVLYPDAGSNIDADKTFRTTRDVISYLPRALMIGLFAPFPSQWFGEGRMLGRAGRLVAGAEMCLVYVITVFASLAVWRTCGRPQTWLLASVVLMAALALGLTVVNLGTLYRLRYTFVILLIVLGAGGLSRYLGSKPSGDSATGTSVQSA